MSDPHVDVGAYALGALSDSEAGAFADHLEACADCRTDLLRLQVAVDTLPLSAPQLSPPPALKGRIMAVVEAEAQLLRAAGPDADRVPMTGARERRRWWAPLTVRPALAVGLASFLVALGVSAGLLADRGGKPVRTHSYRAKVLDDKGRATLVVRGSQATLRVVGLPSPPPGKVYQVWYVRPHNDPQPTHTLFSVRKQDGRADVPIEEPIDNVQDVLVTAEPDGGSTYPSTPVKVIQASRS